MSTYQVPLEVTAYGGNGLIRNIAADPPLGRMDVWAIRRMLSGMAPVSVAVAADVSVRTAYRWRAEVIGLEDIVVGPWRATFVLRRNKPPMRLTVWRMKSW